jgi:NodT family efflux transporter outer membrane factor (OMF) lipoprotein
MERQPRLVSRFAFWPCRWDNQPSATVRIGGRLRLPDQSHVAGRWTAAVLAIAGVAVAACTTQPAYRRPTLQTAPHWSNAAAATAAPTAWPPETAVDWWSQLNDPAIDALTKAALRDNPTLAQALAAVDGARAAARLSHAQRLPQIGAKATASRAQVPNPLPAAAPFTIVENAQTVGVSMSWEVDLWGRLRESALAARDRLDARNADAEQTRLVLVAQIADGVLRLRACNYALVVRDRDLSSRALELDLMARRRAVGNAAPVDEASAMTSLANARTARIRQQETCDRGVDALVALSGLQADAVRAIVAPAREADTSAATGQSPPITDTTPISTPPPLQLALPASVLLRHPAVVSAEREAAARWSEIAVARAERLPRLDLAAALSGNWLQAFGKSISFGAWSLDSALSAPVIDGGAGNARVAGSQALYRQAVANLQATVREAAQNVEDALAAQASADQRFSTSRQALEAGRRLLVAKEAQWRAGAISRFELEDARRAFNTAQEDAVDAARDRAVAWVDLVRASGAAPAHPTAAAEASIPSQQGVPDDPH